MTSTPNRCCVLIYICCIDITFVILKSAYNADILYIIHVIIATILSVQYMIFYNMHAQLVVNFSEIYNLQLGIAERRRRPYNHAISQQ